MLHKLSLLKLAAKTAPLCVSHSTQWTMMIKYLHLWILLYSYNEIWWLKLFSVSKDTQIICYIWWNIQKSGTNIFFQKSLKTGLIWFDGQWNLFLYHLTFQKMYVPSLVEFSTFIELCGEVCNLSFQILQR